MQSKKIKFGELELLSCKENIEYKDDNIAHYFPQIRNLKNPFILESKDISKVYGRLSLIGFDPVLKISGKNSKFKIECLSDRGEKFLEKINEEDFAHLDSYNNTKKGITGEIIFDKKYVDEEEKTRIPTILDAMRAVLEKFKTTEKSFLGLYGAFSYDMVRLFEDLPNLTEDRGDEDFVFYLYDNFLFFDHIKKEAKIVLFREEIQSAEKYASELKNIPPKETKNFKISDEKFDFSREEFMDLVEKARELARQGELFEVVFSREMQAKFEGDSFALYQKYREINPSPYMFYFDFDDFYLVGASPEMMIRVEDGIVHTRPISGTMPRGKNLVEDHENMLYLLSSEKERSELDMLIDLARNDLSRICEKGITMQEYRNVERYSRVMHTIAHVSGKLKKGLTALDAYIACANAGTLTGAPKVAAMCEIEKHEKTRRGYYGGGVGYFSFSGEMDTGIIIRTACIKGNRLSLRAGATLLFDSDAESEFLETENKMEAFLDTF